MPHITVECSSNVLPKAGLTALVAAVHKAALDTGVFELGAVRTRVAVRDVFQIADGDPQHSFVAIVISIGRGRSEETRVEIGRSVFEAANSALAPVFAARPLALSVEIQEIDPTGQFRRNTIHDLMKERHKAPSHGK